MAEKPTCSQRMSAFGRFIYDGEKHTVLGRTPKSWGLIIIFYIIYYTLLAGFFVGMLSVLLFGILNPSVPMRTGKQSILRMYPGLGLRPMPEPETTLVRVDLADEKSYKPYVTNLEKFYNMYSTVNTSLESDKMTYASCDLKDAQANRDFNPREKICRLNPTVDWGTNCTPANSFGYATGQPCIVVKMNRIYGWLPDVSDSNLSNHTLMRCEPENDGDKPTFGNVDPIYSPGVTLNGTRYGLFSSALFPFLNQDGYTIPSVAVQFPGARRNVLMMIQCRLFNLENYEYSKVDREGMVRFELLILNKAGKTK